jgi:TatD DNase family protein
MFIDSHAHLCAPQFKDTWKSVVDRARRAGVTHIINIADDLQEGEWGRIQAEQAENVYLTVGIHPENIDERPEQWLNNVRRIASESRKIVGIGEVGLDYTLSPDRAVQHEVFRQHIELAVDLELPLVIHLRDVPGQTTAWNDAFTILKSYPQARGVFHCWTSTPDLALQALALGFYLSYSGILTYKNAESIRLSAKETPLDRILIETDAPYLLPEPARSYTKSTRTQQLIIDAEFQIEQTPTCEPAHVTMTARKLADILGLTTQEIAEATSKNTIRLFGLPTQNATR